MIKSSNSPLSNEATTTEPTIKGTINTNAGIPDEIPGANSQETHPKKYPTMETKNNERRFLSFLFADKSNRLVNVANKEGKTASPNPNDPPKLDPILVISKPGWNVPDVNFCIAMDPMADDDVSTAFAGRIKTEEKS